MANINLGEPAGNAIAFHVLRSTSIQAYAQLEASLSSLLASLLGNDMKASATIFNRLSNTKSRNLIIEDLIEHRHADKYSHYWHGIPGTKDKSGLMTIIQGLDGKRNEIVHWHAVREIGTEDKLVLMPPSFWLRPSAPKITEDDLGAFLTKASFATRSLNMFRIVIDEIVPKDDTDWHATWDDIFRQPCAYPPADTHPLAQNPQV
jgi:hypothetical protein